MPVPAPRPRRFTDVQCHPDRLEEPLRWRKPSLVFVNSMSDLFHEDVPDEFIGKTLDVMARAHRHQFQVLTKRAERMRDLVPIFAERHTAPDGSGWPLPNVWLGVSVENQHFADERIPLLLQTPAAIRFVSYEPALGPVDFSQFLTAGDSDNPTRALNTHGQTGACSQHGSRLCDGKGQAGISPQASGQGDQEAERPAVRKLNWIIVGGESGPKARPCEVAWIRNVVQQCQAAGVPCFVKQLGAQPIAGGQVIGQQFVTNNLYLRDRKGGDISEFPADLQVREFPNVR